MMSSARFSLMICSSIKHVQEDPHVGIVPCEFSAAMPKTYLAGMAGTHQDEYDTLDEAKAACNASIYCGGITLESSGRRPCVTPTFFNLSMGILLSS